MTRDVVGVTQGVVGVTQGVVVKYIKHCFLAYGMFPVCMYMQLLTSLLMNTYVTVIYETKLYK